MLGGPIAARLRDRQVRASFLALWVVGWGVVLYESLRPLDQPPLGLSDKLLHFVGYAGMAALAAGFCHAQRRLAALGLGTAAAGALIEVAQLFVPHRSFDLLDMAANAAGAALGTLVALAWVWLALRPAGLSRPAPS